MARYLIVAARPGMATNHVRSQFKMLKLDRRTDEWFDDGWLSLGGVGDLLRSGEDVRTGEIVGDEVRIGEAVEIELRIARNGKRFKISDMPTS